MNYIDIVSIGVGIFPWISQIKGLDIHFKNRNFPLKTIFNVFASLFSLAIFYGIGQAQTTDLLEKPHWAYFIVLGFIVLILYFIVLFYKRSSVNSGQSKWPIILNFALYSIFFASITIGFGLQRPYQDHYILNGSLNLKEIGLEPSENKIEIFLYPKTHSSKILHEIPKKNGKFRFKIKKESFENYNRLFINGTGFQPINYTFSSISALKQKIRNVKLEGPI